MDASELKGVAGVGIDVCDVARIAKLIDEYGEAFLRRTFSDGEIAYCSKKSNPAIHYAARFAAKEAMSKALGTGFSGEITLKSLCVGNAKDGSPYAILDSAAKARIDHLNGKTMHISLTHLKDFAQAIAILSK